MRHALASLALACAPVAGEAQVFEARFTGVVASGLDLNNTFGGGAFSDLGGRPFTLTYLVNTAAPGAVLQGNLGFSRVSGAGVSASLTISGQSFTFTGGGSSIFAKVDGLNNPDIPSPVPRFINEVPECCALDIIYGSVSNAMGRSIFTYGFSGSTDAFASPSFSEPVAFSPEFRFGEANISGVLGAVRLTSSQIRIAAVPEPANWAAMALGFGLVGGALRSGGLRRRPQRT